jgi:hypothetical protein
MKTNNLNVLPQIFRYFYFLEDFKQNSEIRELNLLAGKQMTEITIRER